MHGCRASFVATRQIFNSVLAAVDTALMEALCTNVPGAEVYFLYVEYFWFHHETQTQDLSTRVLLQNRSFCLAPQLDSAINGNPSRQISKMITIQNEIQSELQLPLELHKHYI